MQRYPLGIPQGFQIFRVDTDDEHVEIVDDAAGQFQLEGLVPDRGRGGVDLPVSAGFVEIDIMDAVEAAHEAEAMACLVDGPRFARLGRYLDDPVSISEDDPFEGRIRGFRLGWSLYAQEESGEGLK